MRKLKIQTQAIKIFAFFEDIILGYVTGLDTATNRSNLEKKDFSIQSSLQR